MSEKKLVSAYKHMIYMELKIDNKGRPVFVKGNFIKKWITNNPDIRQYLDIGVYPEPLKVPEDIFNLWRPFAFSNIEGEYEARVKEKNIILEHINILCGREPEAFNYFLKWIGQMLKYPAVKTICPTLISEEGAGKGTLLFLLRRMMGKKNILENTEPSRDVWGSFNGRMECCFFVNLNELSLKECKDSEGKMKGLITDEALLINKKGSDVYEIESYHRFLVTSNKEEPIKTKKGDRRNFVIRSSDELCENKQYFEEMYEYLNDDEVIRTRTMFDFFVNIEDLDKFNLLRMPTTEYQKGLQKKNGCPIELFFKEWTCENFDFVNEKKEPLKIVLSSSIFKAFEKFIDKNRMKYEIGNTTFGMKLKMTTIKGIAKGTRKQL
jgi:hypothetical protein